MSKLWAIVVNRSCKYCEKKLRSIDRKEATSMTDNNDGVGHDDTESRRTKLIILAGMVAAFSTILPTPASAILLCLELPGFEALTKQHGLSYVKTVSQLTIAGTVSFLVFDFFYDNTYLPTESLLPGFLHVYSTTDVFIGIFFGLMGAALALVYFIIAGLTKGLTGKAKVLLDDKVGKEKRILILATVGGTLFGVLGYIFPLTVGDGSYQIGTVIIEGGNMSTAVLVASLFVDIKRDGFCGRIAVPSPSYGEPHWANICERTWLVLGFLHGARSCVNSFGVRSCPSGHDGAEHVGLQPFFERRNIYSHLRGNSTSIVCRNGNTT